MGGKHRATRARTLASDFHARAVHPVVEADAGSAWPSPRWQSDPVGFCREVLAVGHVMPHQVEVLEAAAGGEAKGSTRKIAIKSGQKIGKTKLVVCLALWFYACFPGARVIMTANTKDQVRRVLWKELRETRRAAKVHIDGLLGKTPESGLKAEDGREIIGCTVRTIEAMSGISGKNMIFIVDEASALSQEMYEAIEGNTAGGAWIILLSNPTRTEGPFFDAFHAKKEFWETFSYDAEAIATWQRDNGCEVEGVVNMQWLEQREREYGRESPFFIVRVKGDFLRNETGKVVTLDQITRAQERWNDTDPEDGPLSIGLDPAGPGGSGDETAFGIVRGQKLVGLFCFRALTEDAIVVHLESFLEKYRRPGETPRVTVDNEGPIGSALFWRLRALAEKRRSDPALAFACVGCKASMPATREPLIYERTREELWASVALWIREGGAIPPDHKLERELHAPNWSGTLKGKLRLTPKEDLREKLGRSPDRAEALALAVWQPPAWLVDEVPAPPPARDTYQQQAETVFDPYAGSDAFFEPR